MTEAMDPSEGQGLAFLRDLIDRYGVTGLTERLAAAIEEAEGGRVAGPGLDEAADWLEQDQGPRIDAMFVGTNTLMAAANVPLSVETTAEGVVQKAAEDFATAVDQAAITITESAEVVVANLPTNMQVLAQVHDTFLYLVGAWGLLDVPIEAMPVVMLMALAIVVVRIRLKQR